MATGSNACRCSPMLVIVVLISCGGSQGKPSTSKRAYAFNDFPASEWAEGETEGAIESLAPDDRRDLVRTPRVEDSFAGVDREGAKTSIVSNASLEQFDSITELQGTLPADDAMRDHDPPLKRDSMERVVEEQRRVRVKTWIYALKYESDNDWHVIIGTDPNDGDVTYLNAEISGLPARTAKSYDSLSRVRRSFTELLGNDLPRRTSYRKYSPPIAVVLEGSLFYDIDHPPGAVGPKHMQPQTAWEIHPISSISER